MREGHLSTDNPLDYGNNLETLKQYISEESVDLVYLDPPFNSNQNYNVLFREKSGALAASQIGDSTQQMSEATADLTEVQKTH